MPHRIVAVQRGSVGRKTAMDQAELGDSGILHPGYRPAPQFDVGIHRVFDQHRHVGPFQRIGNILHAERIDRRTGPHPDHIHPEFEGGLDVFRRGHFGSDRQAGQFAGLTHPRQTFEAHSFERTGLRPGFPDAGAQYVDQAGRSDLPTSLECLFLRLRAARAGDNQGTFRFDIKRFHILMFFTFPVFIPANGRRTPYFIIRLIRFARCIICFSPSVSSFSSRRRKICN